ncbi:hypothetical protein ACFLRA_03495 [Bdellovibrionota bacterium]
MKIPLILSILFILPPGVVHALPAYSLRERIRCGQCHVNKAGGGPRNPRGVFFSKNNTLKGFKEPGVITKPPVVVAAGPRRIKKITKPAKIVVARAKVPKKVTPPPAKPPKKPPVVIAKKPPAPPPVQVTKLEPTTPWTDRVQWGGDIRMWFNGSRADGAPKKFGLDQVEPSVSIDVNPAINVVFAYNFANPLLTAYGQYLFPHVEDAYLKVGSFHAPIGLPYVDHTALLKDRYDIGVDTRDVGIEVGYSKDLNVQLAFVNGGREPNRFGLPPFLVADEDYGAIGNISYRSLFGEIPFLIGSSVVFERRVPPGIYPPGEIPIVRIPGTNPPYGESSLENEDIRANTFIWDFYFHAQIQQIDLLGEIAFGQNTPYVILDDPKDSMAFFGEIRYRLNDKWRFAFRYDHFIEDRQFLGTFVQRFVPSVRWQFAEYASVGLLYRNTSLKGNAIPFLTAPRAQNDNILLLFHFWL